MSALDRIVAAEQLVRSRRLRAECMGALNDAFGDASWGMLLRLFLDGERGVDTTVADLVEASLQREEYAKLHVGFLASHYAVEVEGMEIADVARGVSGDRRVKLTDRGRERMEAYLTREAMIADAANNGVKVA